ncbi:MAG: type II secretion system GspH family protein [Alphaproteobacteria bacterium]
MRKSQGFTLVEVMVGMVLTAILVLGLSSAWVLTSTEFLRLTLRQKAIMALNGETERLAYYYAHDSTTQIKSSSCLLSESITVDGAAISANLYPKAACTLDGNHILNTNLVDVGQVFVLETGTLPSNRKYNVVWLDKEKGLAASLFWTVADSTATNAANCLTYTCQDLTVYLQYPYRFTPSATEADGTLVNDLPPVETVSVKTIVGNRGGLP